MRGKHVIDTTYSREGPGPKRYLPIIEWCLEQGARLEGSWLADPFRGGRMTDPAKCHVEGDVRLADVLERFELPEGVILDEQGSAFTDRRENVRMIFRAPSETDADVLARHGEASLSNEAADSALASFLRMRESVHADIRDTDMTYTDAVSAKIYEALSGSDLAVALDKVLQRLGATPASRLGTLTHFKVRYMEDTAGDAP